jgi:hypothetical protein
MARGRWLAGVGDGRAHPSTLDLPIYSVDHEHRQRRRIPERPIHSVAEMGSASVRSPKCELIGGVTGAMTPHAGLMLETIG